MRAQYFDMMENSSRVRELHLEIRAIGRKTTSLPVQLQVAVPRNDAVLCRGTEPAGEASRDRIGARRSGDGQAAPAAGSAVAAAWSIGEPAMRRSQRSRASCRPTNRRGMPRWLAVATGALIIALVLEVALGLPAAAPVRAQVMVTAQPSVTVHGTGEATVPAEMATVQILIGHGGRQFGFSQGASGGEVFESGSSIAVPGGPPEPERVPQATPETSAAGTESAVSPRESRGSRNRRPGSEPITAERLAPVVVAVAASAGIAPDAVAIIFSPLATEPFGAAEERSA